MDFFWYRIIIVVCFVYSQTSCVNSVSKGSNEQLTLAVPNVLLLKSTCTLTARPHPLHTMANVCGLICIISENGWASGGVTL